MTIKKKLIVLPMLVLCSCAGINKESRIKEDTEILSIQINSEQVCQEKLRNKELKTATQTISCERELVEKEIDTRKYIHKNIYEEYYDYKTKIAANYDLKKASKETYESNKRKLDNIYAQVLVNEIDNRENEIAQDNEAIAQTVSAILSAYGNGLKAAGQNQEQPFSFPAFCSGRAPGGSADCNK